MPKRRNPAAARSMKARTTRGRRRSPDRIRERSQKAAGGGNRPITRGAYDPMTYGRPDVASLGDPRSDYASVSKVKQAQDYMPSPNWRGGRGHTDRDVPLRRMAVGGPKPGSEAAKQRRKRSTESALHRADASMFNYDD